VRSPARFGANLTDTVQLALGGRGFGQALVCGNSDDCEAMLSTGRGTVPELVRVTSCAALVVPGGWLGNVSGPGATSIQGACSK
jgi:hypothetical protein